MSERYIVIRNWGKFQHYKDNTRPSWIKTYTRLLHDSAWLDLNNAQRGILLGLWLSYASNGQRPLNETLSRTRLATNKGESRHFRATIDALNHAGFIDVGSREALEQLYPREEEEKIRTLSKDVSRDSGEKTERENHNDEKSGWVENLSSYTGCRYVRGEYALTAVYDILGTERPPTDWPHERPSRKEILKALTEQAQEQTVA